MCNCPELEANGVVSMIKDVSYQGMKRHQGILTAAAQWKKPSWEAALRVTPFLWGRKRESYSRGGRPVAAGRGWSVKPGTFGWRNDSVWNCHCGYMMPRIHQNPTKVFSMNANVCKFLKYHLAGWGIPNWMQNMAPKSKCTTNARNPGVKVEGKGVDYLTLEMSGVCRKKMKQIYMSPVLPGVGWPLWRCYTDTDTDVSN